MNIEENPKNFGRDNRLLLEAEKKNRDVVKYLINAGADINCCNRCGDYTVLHYAAEYGWLDIVQSLLKKGVNTQVKSKYVNSPLLLAAKNYHKDIIDLLINSGADVNFYDRHNNNYTVLHYASRHGWLPIVQSLLKQNADIEVKTIHGDTPLLLAAAYRNLDIVKYLINAEANIKCSGEDNYTLLHYASLNGWVEIVQYLLDKGADIQVKTKCDDSSLILAARRNRKDVVELLMNAGADINCFDSSNYCTLLHYASKNGWLEIALSLLKESVDIESKTKFKNKTPLLVAAEYGHRDIVELLINAGADLNCAESKYNYTVFHYASENGWLEIVQSLLKKGVDINAKTSYLGTELGTTPLVLAASKHHTNIVEFLMNAEADINCLDAWRNFAVLHYASHNGWLGILQSLLKKGADIELKTRRGDTPLLLAVEGKHLDTVKYLINAKANIKCSNEDNYTVLHYASRNGWLEIVQSLLKKHVNIDARCVTGATSLQIAFDNNELEIAENLINAGADVNISNNGYSALSNLIITKSSDIKLVRLLITSGVYLRSFDYKSIMENPLLKEHILQDIELCSQAILNEFNHKDLPKLYELPMACRILPRLEDMRIGNNGQVAHEVLQSVKHEVQVKGHCNVLEVRPKVLKIMSVKSLLSYCDDRKKQDGASKQMKRSAEFDYDNQHLSKMGRFN